MKCAACEGDMVVFTRSLCRACIYQLPPQTVKAYATEEITTRQAVDALRTRTASVKVFGGGRIR